jgi:16S rRNA (uracil1498-N3)-methyltransferase
MARFFLPKERIQDQRGTIVGEELAHLRKVLRLGPGDRLTVFDDTGWEHEAVIRSFTADRGDIDILRSYRPERESSVKITLALGLTKGEKTDFVVEKATELGVQVLVPFISSYTVPKLNDRKIEARTERWQRIALSAAKQCGRTVVPKILTLCEFRELMSQPWTDTLKLLFWEREGQLTLKQVYETDRDARAILLVIGPEGGFSSEEADKAQQAGFKSVQLGRRILRSETAALAALSVVQFLWGDIG